MRPQIEISSSTSRGLPAVVAPPHPLYGGRMDNPVVVALADALRASGYAPLRFNWRGVGASTGSASGRVEDAEADYRAALAESQRLARDTGMAGPAVLLAGYSFGAVAALRVALSGDAQPAALTLVAPPLAMIEALDFASLECPVHVIAGEHDQFAPRAALAGVLSRAAEVRLDVIPDADHFFGRDDWIEKISELVRARLV